MSSVDAAGSSPDDSHDAARGTSLDDSAGSSPIISPDAAAGTSLDDSGVAGTSSDDPADNILGAAARSPVVLSMIDRVRPQYDITSAGATQRSRGSDSIRRSDASAFDRRRSARRWARRISRADESSTAARR